MVNVEPLPGVLSTVTSPPSMVQKCLVMASPRPVPPKRLVVEASAWLNAWNSRPSCSFVMPTPVSDTREADPGIALARHRQGQRALARELVGVAQQIEQALFYLGLVGAEAANIGRANHLDDILTLVGERLDDRQHLFNQRLNVYRLDEDIHLSGFDLRQVENVVDQSQQVAAGTFDLLQIVDRLFVALVDGVLLQDFAVADDRIQRRAQLMRHVGEEARFGPVGFVGSIARRGELGK